MPLMERIVRPYVSVDTGPSKQEPKCQRPAEPTILTFRAPSGLGTDGVKTPNGGVDLNKPNTSNPSPQHPQEPKDSEKSKNSSWKYAYKRYMTKIEKEEDKCADEGGGEGRVTGGQATDAKVAADSGGGASTSPGAAPPASGPGGPQGP